jgi:multisubunit Na+/H+ antiporter MnhG subunit
MLREFLFILTTAAVATITITIITTPTTTVLLVVVVVVVMMIVITPVHCHTVCRLCLRKNIFRMWRIYVLRQKERDADGYSAANSRACEWLFSVCY